MKSQPRWFAEHVILTLCHGLPAIAAINGHPQHWSLVVGGLEPGVPGVTAWLDVHVYVATRQRVGTRHPTRPDTIHVSRGHVVGQSSPGGTSEVKPALGAASTPETGS